MIILPYLSLFRTQPIPKMSSKGQAEPNKFDHQQLSNFLRDAPVGITVLRGPDFIVEMATRTYLEIVDRKESEFVGRSLFDSLPEVRSAVEPLLSNVYASGAPYFGNEFPVTLNRYGQSKTAFFNFVYQPAYDDNGKVNGIIVVANEVTSLVIAKQNLTESERKFKDLVMQSPMPITIFKGEDFVIDLANHRMIDTIWRKKESEVMGKPLLEVFPELNDQKYPELLRKVYHDGIIHSEKESVAYVDGDDGMRKFYLDYSYEPLFDSSDNVFGILVTLTDVTEKVESRKRLEEIEEKLRLAIDSADLGTYEVDLINNKIKTSERFREIWGIKEELSRQNYADFVHPEDQPARQEAHRQSLITGVLTYEARLVKRDNTQSWISANGKILFDKDGKAVTLVGVIQDITEQKEFARELERQVQERTEELQTANEEIVATNEELSEANNSLVKANLELEQFNYATSHDLQEPVRKIQTFANFLIDSPEITSNKKNEGYAKKILSAADRMKNIIIDLLQYSHHARGERQYELNDLNLVIETVKSDLELIIEQKHAVIKSDLLPIVNAIPRQMHQLFMNLISNSLKFTKAGSDAHITIQVTKLSDSLKKQFDLKGNYHHITVRDNGIGFEPKFAEYVFELFKRLHPRNEYAGTGIGLALCKKIVENHEGVIFAESQPDDGTSIHVILPVLEK